MLRPFLSLCLLCFPLLPSCKDKPSKPQWKKTKAAADSPLNPDDAAAETEAIRLTSTAFPRLSHLQWENSVRDILLLDKTPGLSADFLPDPPGSIFGNDSSLLKITPNLWVDYQKAAEKLASDTVGNAERLKKLIPGTAAASGEARAHAILLPLATRAYRRPPTEGEKKALLALYQKGPELTGKADATQAGVQVLITALLQAPNFLYRPELGKERSAKIVKLNAYEIASRLSYAVWNTIPDDALLKAAESGELLKPEIQKAQAERLMKDDRASVALSYFYAKALRIDSFLNIVEKDKMLYPEWSADINNALHAEALAFINDVVNTSAKGLHEILTAPYTFVNAKNAPLYGLTATGDAMQRVELDPKQRSGFLTQIGFLALNATPVETDPIHRGVYTTVNFTCADLVPPPGTIPNLPKESGAKSMRERVEAHTGKGTCGGTCHGERINPAGYAFENFDAAGRWRIKDKGFAIDAAATYSFDGSLMSFDGPVAFAKALAGRSEVHSCFAGKALELLYGRVQSKADEDLIGRLAKRSLSGASTRELFLDLLIDPKIAERVAEE